MATGAYQRLKRSIKRAIGAFVAWASSTMWTMRASVLSAAVFVISIRSSRSPLMLPA
jgi:hypothetical protein